MSTPLKIESTFHFDRQGRGARKELRMGEGPQRPAEPGRLPRITRFMALAIRFDRLLREGAIESYAELAQLGHVTRARVTQIMNLLHLAPDIQEQILFLPRTQSGRDIVILMQLQRVTQMIDWSEQRAMWRDLLTPSTEPSQPDLQSKIGIPTCMEASEQIV